MTRYFTFLDGSTSQGSETISGIQQNGGEFGVGITSVVQMENLSVLSSVGIGTTIPEFTLDIRGSISCSEDIIVTGIITTSNLNVTGTITNFNSTNLVGAALSISGISTFTNGPMFIGSATSTGTSSQKLQVTGGTYVSGSVGIGTTNPSKTLEVRGVARVGLANTAILLGDDSGRNVDVGAGSTNLDCYVDFYGTPTYSDYGGRLIRYAGDNSNFDLVNRGTGALRIVSQDAGTIDFATNNTFRARFDSSGNLGIGTTNPTEKLHVVGNTIISQDLKFNSGYGSAATAYGVRAWVQTGDTTTINGSANISSVSEPLTTQKQINFTTAMPDANYAVCVTADDTGSGGGADGQLYGTIITNTTGSVTARFSDDASLNAVGNTYWIVVR